MVGAVEEVGGGDAIGSSLALRAQGYYSLSHRMMTACRQWMVWVARCGIAAALLCGCSSDDERLERAHKDGYRQGHRQGLLEGVQQGDREATKRYETRAAWRGMALGILIGAGMLALATRKHIGERYRAARDARQVRRLLSECPKELDEDIRERILDIGLRKRRLEEELKTDESVLVAQLFANVSYRLKQMDTGIVRLATLLQQLRDTEKRVSVDRKAVTRRLAELKRQQGKAGGEREREALEQALEVETLRLQTLEQTTGNMRRCELKLDTLSAFVDNLQMAVGNLRTVEAQDAFERFETEVGQSVKDLESFFDRTLGQLFVMPKA